MGRLQVRIAAIVLAAAAAVIGYAGWHMLRVEQASVCAACARPLHLQTQVDAQADGEAVHFCCLACAFRDQEQTGRETEVIRLHDHATGEPLEPEEAVLVAGSRVNYCMRHQPLLGEHKETSRLEYDRCAPSILAFRSRAAARAFADANGGAVMSFEQVRRSFQ